MGRSNFTSHSAIRCAVHVHYTRILSICNLLQRPVEGIRDRLYGFVMYSPKQEEGPQAGEPKTDMALDISFGSSGYALVLARAFKKVCSKILRHAKVHQCTYELLRALEE